MKKYKSILVFALSLILVSCGQDKPKNNKETKNEIQSETKTETKTETISETKKEVKDSNHNGKAAAYAHDVVKIRELSEQKGYTGKKIAFLTFDDGPNHKITPKILDVLKEKGVHATFFMPGKNIGKDTADVVKRVYYEGHAIATHSYTHDYDVLYPKRCAIPEKVLEETQKSEKNLKDILGQNFKTRVFRYPGGHMSWKKDCLASADKLLEKNGYIWIDWNTMNGDAQRKNAGPNDISRPTNTKEVIANFEKSKGFTRNSDIAVILMHDAADKQVTADALGALIDHIKNDGYEFGILE